MTLLSAVIITYNESKNIRKCILSLQGVVDEIIILDSFSDDDTVQIAVAEGATVISRAWQGYSLSKNYANSIAKHDWILSIDADEVLSPELTQSIVSWKKMTIPVSASFNRLTNYCGQWVRHCGWYPDVKYRIFNRNVTKWVGDIHEELCDKETMNNMHLDGDLLHYTYYNIQEHINQIEKFTTIAAHEMYNNGKTSNLIKEYISPLFKWIKIFILKKGFLDGMAGWNIAKYSALGVQIKYRKLDKLYRSR